MNSLIITHYLMQLPSPGSFPQGENNNFVTNADDVKRKEGDQTRQAQRSTTSQGSSMDLEGRLLVFYLGRECVIRSRGGTQPYKVLQQSTKAPSKEVHVVLWNRWASTAEA